MNAIAQFRPQREAVSPKFHVKPTVIFPLCREMDAESFHTAFGTVLKRIRKFCDRFDTDAKGLDLMRAVEQDAVKDSADREFFIVVAIRDGEIVGHLMARLVFYFGNLLTYVHQLEIDRDARVNAEQMQTALSWVKAWGHERGSKKMKAAALTERHARRLVEEYGFRRELIMLGKDVS